ncbi:HIG1 domain family member 1A, mitochondrial [Culicoides brevitarsis]|uniref:HIG1 domain family member 1A, mitochondrial n=1 Tax=Culicoides brevitarsis TaxID=469753 RepID=UPI00307C9042
MAQQVPPTFDWEQESQTEKMARKAKESPFMIFGLVGLATALGIGAYKYKNRGTMSTSVFLMQLRVAAQGTVVACLTAGIGYQLANEYFLKSSDKKD